MQLTAELSLYPLQDEYIPCITDFILSLRETQGITVISNAMSTQLRGDYQRVFDLVATALQRSYQRHGKQVLVCKFIVGELAIDQPVELG